MEREIIELRKQIASTSTSTPQAQQSLPTGQLTPKQDSSQVSPAGVYQTPSALSTDQYMGSQEAVASLLDLRSGFDGSNFMRNGNQPMKRLEDVMIAPDKVTELFNLYAMTIAPPPPMPVLTPQNLGSSCTATLSSHS